MPPAGPGLRKTGQRRKAPKAVLPAGRVRTAPVAMPSPEDHLARALEAKTPRSRGLWARRGLAARARIDKTTQSMLLRQLYLCHYEQHQFQEAVAIASQSLKLGIMVDVVRQDVARAHVALGDFEAAAEHLRLAVRVGPAHRRAFHYWTLGSVYLLAKRYDEAIAALSRAARWGTRDKPLYQAHLALARSWSGERVRELRRYMERLSEVPAGRGYGRFVLGHLAFLAGEHDEAKDHLSEFVERTENGRPTTAIALDGELHIARKTLRSIAKSQRTSTR